MHGIDISQRFVDIAQRQHAPAGATFERADARALRFDAEFDAAISLCQGAFGLVGAGPGTDAVRDAAAGSTIDPDGTVLAGLARAVRPGGAVAVSAFSAYFMVRFLEDTDTFDAGRGVNHERTAVRSEQRDDLEVDLWTSCFTPRELRLLADASGLVVDHVHGVTPGAYAAARPTSSSPSSCCWLTDRPDPLGRDRPWGSCGVGVRALRRCARFRVPWQRSPRAIRIVWIGICSIGRARSHPYD